MGRAALYAASLRNTLGRAVGATVAYTDAQRATARAIWDFWKSIPGCTELDCAAWVADADGECSFLINVWGDHGEAVGIAQHHKARRDIIQKYTKIDMATANVLGQCQGILWEVTAAPSAYRNVLRALVTTESLRDKVAVLVTRFEQSAQRDRDVARRTAMATYWLGQFGTQKPAIS